MFAVIMAGGGGTRLWPKSRENDPKQMHALVGEKPLVQETADRLVRIVGSDNVFIVTNSHHAEAIQAMMPCRPGMLLIDPFRRDTAPCIGLAAVYLSRIDADAVMGIFAADHFIGDEAAFGRIVRAGAELAAEGHVVTIGIKPTGPETGYGYIEFCEPFGAVQDVDVYHAKRFVEKPNLVKAKQYCASGRYLWNSGMFIWSIPTVLRLFERHLPDVHERLMRIRDAIGTDVEQEVLLREYEQMQRVSVDYAIMEKLDDILVISGDFDWNDIGSWATVHDIAPSDEVGNSIRGLHLGIDTSNSLVLGQNGKVIATIGVDDLVIVDTERALLVCRKDRAQDVKKIVDALKERGMEDFF